MRTESKFLHALIDKFHSNISGEPLWQPLPGRLAARQTKFYSQAQSAGGKGEQI